MDRLRFAMILVMLTAAASWARAAQTAPAAPATAPSLAAPPAAAPAPPLPPLGPLSLKLDPSGLVQVVAGDAALATIELNAHGPQWKHAAQATATATVSALPDGTGRRFVGTLPIPGTDGGVLDYTEIVKPLPQGLRLEYSLGVKQAVKLNGLQVSVYLPVARYAGQELVISTPDADPLLTTLPAEQPKEGTGVWGGAGAKLEVAKGSDQAVTIELLAAADVTIQDLRKWGDPAFEIRFPAIMEDPPREVTPGDRFHLVLTVTFAAPVQPPTP